MQGGNHMPISEKNLLKLANGSDVRGVSIEGVADEPVTLNAEVGLRPPPAPNAN